MSEKTVMIHRQASCPKHEKQHALLSFSCETNSFHGEKPVAQLKRAKKGFNQNAIHVSIMDGIESISSLLI